jgi:hypothetical protein
MLIQINDSFTFYLEDLARIKMHLIDEHRTSLDIWFKDGILHTEIYLTQERCKQDYKHIREHLFMKK